jgi:hypothetical protein
MARRNDQKDFIRDEITEQLALVVDSFRPHGWKRLTYWLREWGLAGAAIAVPVTLLAICVAVGVFAAYGIKENTQFRTRTEDTLTGIEGRLGGVENSLKLLQAQLAVSRFSSVPPKELKSHREELAEVKNTLATVPHNTPNFWPASFQIITLLSQATSGVEPTSQRESVFSDVVGPGIVVPDGIHVFLKNRIQNMVFTNSVVRFDSSVLLKNVTFINCIFIFPPVEQHPPKPLQQIGSELLSADLSHATVSGGY